jgi:hypothetical protein
MNYMMTIVILFLTLFFADAATPSKPAIVKIADIPYTKVEPGKPATATIKISVAKGYHVQANPPSEKYLIPTEIQLKPSDGITIGKPIYPKGKPYRLKGSSSDLSTYDGTFDIQVPLKIDKAVTTDSQVLKGKLRYQACDDKVCLRPESIPLELHVDISK